MKIYVSSYSDLELEKLINQKHAEIKGQARKNAGNFANRNLPKPTRDTLAHYTGEIRGAYEELAAFIHQRLQPDAHLPKVRMKSVRMEDKKMHIDNEVNVRGNQNNSDAFQLKGYHPQNIISRIRIALLVTFLFCIGEILFNVQAFQFTGENMLFSLIIAVSLSFAVFVLSHLAPLLYKSATTRIRRWVIIIGTLLLANGLFIALAVLRSIMFAEQNISISPQYFVIINLFFFVVSCFLSFYILPSWEEIKEHQLHLEKYRNIKKRNKEIEAFKKEKEQLQDSMAEQTMQHIQAAIYAKHLDERIIRMCRESIEIFKSTNLLLRTDGETPDCFKEVQSDVDISYSSTQIKIIK
jgi:hypothetical protein